MKRAVNTHDLWPSLGLGGNPPAASDSVRHRRDADDVQTPLEQFTAIAEGLRE